MFMSVCHKKILKLAKRESDRQIDSPDSEVDGIHGVPPARGPHGASVSRMLRATL
jgi:hypothetical protein